MLVEKLLKTSDSVIEESQFDKSLRGEMLVRKQGKIEYDLQNISKEV